MKWKFITKMNSSEILTLSAYSPPRSYLRKPKSQLVKKLLLLAQIFWLLIWLFRSHRCGYLWPTFLRRLPWQLLRCHTSPLALPPLLMLNTEAAFDFCLSVFRGSSVPRYFLLPRLTFSLPWRPDPPTQLRSETLPSVAQTKTLVPKVCSIITEYCLVKEEFLLLFFEVIYWFSMQRKQALEFCV